ncbi:biotin transporter BioY [Alicycliphilus denitrificans]|uniref:Biotin transporter n=1 Tax=Alicycliphilus denitrificans TaxID=179636 RepID=A0A3R7HW10_9BURK|nr:biotin transporter BioY [Alicycliphilus denitrificans]RKJ97105.1 biotin transporter BioY [Alicycliphilus denitrificans]
MTIAVSRKTSHSMALVALFAALMAVMGLIPKIDLPLGVPITLQSLGVMLAGCLLGARRGFQAMLLFLAAVAAGLPLLAGGRGGLGVFMAPSAGYLVGYALAAGVTGALMRLLPQGTPLRTAASAFAASVLGGLVFLHAMGIAGLMLMAQMPLDKAFLADLVFVPGDLVKCVLCAVVVHTVSRALPDWPFGGREH